MSCPIQAADVGGVGHEGFQGFLGDYWRKLGDGLRILRASARTTMRGGQEGVCLRLCPMRMLQIG